MSDSRAKEDRLEEGAHDHDRGLDYDLPRLISRRQALGAIAGGIGSTALVACGGGGSDDTTTSSSAATESSAVPEETAGPFPADGSNGPDVLSESGVVRRDITKSFGDFDGTAEGVPTSIDLTLLDIAGGGAPLAGAAVYLWHCDRDGGYSLYDAAVTDQNYLRGVQVSDDDGKLRFETVFPACYAGRWPHIHFEVYESLDTATAGEPKLRTSQLALPADVCDAVYSGAEGYEQSQTNVSQVSLEGDMVFADGYSSQLANSSGSVEDGIGLTLNVGV